MKSSKPTPLSTQKTVPHFELSNLVTKTWTDSPSTPQRQPWVPVSATFCPHRLTQQWLNSGGSGLSNEVGDEHNTQSAAKGDPGSVSCSPPRLPNPSFDPFELRFNPGLAVVVFFSSHCIVDLLAVCQNDQTSSRLFPSLPPAILFPRHIMSLFPQKSFTRFIFFFTQQCGF